MSGRENGPRARKRSTAAKPGSSASPAGVPSPPLRLGDVLRSLCPLGDLAVIATSPADLFGCCWALLHAAGSVDDQSAWSWGAPEQAPRRGATTSPEFDHAVRDWRRLIRASSPQPQPPQWVADRWAQVLDAVDEPVLRLQGANTGGELRARLLELLSAADETCSGVGFPRKRSTPTSSEREPDLDDGHRRRALEAPLQRTEGRTLCALIDPTRLVVLPKSHTPDKGVTLRSFSHYLAAWQPSGVDVRWRWLPSPVLTDRASDAIDVNVLLLPWPLAVTPREIRPRFPARSRREGEPPHAPFTFRRAAPIDADDVAAALAAAERVVDQIHVVLFPELALRPGDATTLAGLLGRVVIAGAGESATESALGSNTAELATPVKPRSPGSGADVVVSSTQPKHHPWRIDRAQIQAYGLGGSLTPNRDWWEAIPSMNRTLTFSVLREGLSFCLLVCEDLARQEPVAPIVRAVGPDLVIGLLMDGPQLDARWPARYASVLADDPGSSVLTVTSLGMSLLSRPPGKDPSRVVALWRDAVSPPQMLSLAPEASGLVLTLSRTPKTEWTADGRSDRGTSGVVTLTGTHPVFVPRPTGRRAASRPTPRV